MSAIAASQNPASSGPASSGWTCTTAPACAASRAGARTAGTMPAQEMSFGEFLGNMIDVINPLQHIPVVSSVYRNLTGDQIGGAARIAGGALYGGPLGGAMAVADVAMAQEKGGYVADTMLAGLMGGGAAVAATLASSSSSSAQSMPVMTAQAAADIAPAAGDTVTLAGASDQSHFTSSSSLSASPTPNRTRTAHSELVTSRAPDTPVIRHAGAEIVPATVRISGGADAPGRLTALPNADASSSLPKAPADPRMGLPPELMALKMQEGLDKYAAMKSRGL